MKLALFLAVGILVLPPVAEAQIEIGCDSGVTVDRTLGTNLTTFEIPSSNLRVGFPGATFTFETLASFTVQRRFDETTTVIRVLPGIVYHWRPTTYFRGEAGLRLLNDSGSSLNQFAFGVAVGNKRQIGPGPLYLRFEFGLDQWRQNSDFFAHSEFRGLVGISVVVN